MDSCDTDVRQALDAILQRSGADGSLLGDGEIAGPGRTYEHGAPPRRRWFGIGREEGRASQLIDLDARKAGCEHLRLRPDCSSGEKAAARLLQAFCDVDELSHALAP